MIRDIFKKYKDVILLIFVVSWFMTNVIVSIYYGSEFIFIPQMIHIVVMLVLTTIKLFSNRFNNWLSTEIKYDE